MYDLMIQSMIADAERALIERDPCRAARDPEVAEMTERTFQSPRGSGGLVLDMIGELLIAGAQRLTGRAMAP